MRLSQWATDGEGMMSPTKQYSEFFTEKKYRKKRKNILEKRDLWQHLHLDDVVDAQYVGLVVQWIPKLEKKCIQSTVAVEEEILVEKSLKKSERILRKMAIFPKWKKKHTKKQLFKIKSISSSGSSSNRISHYRKNLQLNFLTHLDSWMDDKWWFGNFYNTFNLLSFLCQLKRTF